MQTTNVSVNKQTAVKKSNGKTAKIRKTAAQKKALQERIADTINTKVPLTYEEVAMSRIVPNPHNPRKTFDEKPLDELAESIRFLGLIQPILLRPMEEKAADGQTAMMIVFGERRWRAAQRAGLPAIPSFIGHFTDEQVRDIAVAENLHRVELAPVEEAAEYQRQVKEDKKTVKDLIATVGKDEAYIRRRMNLTKLIPEVSELLEQGEISITVAEEFAKYEEDIQTEVFREHFSPDAYRSWKGIRAADFARQLYDNYITKLDSYNFDKTECAECGNNTHKQVLFVQDGECPGCTNPACMYQKNVNYIVSKALAILEDDPCTVFVEDDDANATAVESLIKEGHEVGRLAYHINCYDKYEEPEKPLHFGSEELYNLKMQEYEKEKELYANVMRDCRKKEIEGSLIKYAVIQARDVTIVYEEIVPEIEVVETPAGDVVEVKMPELKPVDGYRMALESARRTYCQNLMSGAKAILDRAKVPQTPFSEKEEGMLYVVLLGRMAKSRREEVGISGLEDMSAEEQLEYTAGLTTEQKIVALRCILIEFFRAHGGYGITEESLPYQMIRKFTEIHYREDAEKLETEVEEEYEKKRTSLQARIREIEAENIKIQAEIDRLAAQRAAVVDTVAEEITIAGLLPEALPETIGVAMAGESDDDPVFEPAEADTPDTVPDNDRDEEPAGMPEPDDAPVYEPADPSEHSGQAA